MKAILSISLLFLFSCEALSADSYWNIFGIDNREAITSNQHPWRTIGFVAGSRCTGTLVSKNLVLTAAHCVIDSDTRTLRKDLTYFYPNMVGGHSESKSLISHVWWGTTNPSNRADDWAVLLLAENLGDKYGWMGIRGDGDYYKDVSLAGYSADFRGGNTATVHRDCKVRNSITDVLISHDCDMTRGASGGPLFILQNGSAFIVGLNVAERREGGERSLNVSYYSEEYENIAVRVGRFLPKMRSLRQIYDSRE